MKLSNALKPYAWGSHTLLSDFEGRPPASHPEAERWMGTHPAAPSRVSPEQTLQEHRRAQGHPTGELPWLLKVLAARQPLSLQAHPNEAQAREGYAREQAQGLALDAPTRSYKDPHAKPELIVALSEFSALCGFLQTDAMIARLSDSGVDAIDGPLRDARTMPEPEALAFLLRTWITGPVEPRRDALIRFVSRNEARLRAQTPWIFAVISSFEGDPTALIALMLHHVTLSPGEGLYLEAGVMHAYLGGLGVELMGPSDNVLRGGLTPKHVDPEELQKVLRFEPSRVQPLTASGSDARAAWRTPGAPFELAQTRVKGKGAWDEGPTDEIVLCTEGSVRLGELTLRRGESAYLAQGSGPREVWGEGCVMRASGSIG